MDLTHRPSRPPSACVRGRVASSIGVSIVCLGLLSVVAGCATPGRSERPSSASGRAGLDELAAALWETEPEAARKLLTAALRAEPQNGYLHLLNGLNYQRADASQRSAELAQVGYDAAVKFAPGFFWSHYLSGLSRFRQNDYSAAAQEFAAAIMDRPHQPQALAGLAAAAYYAGDLDVARSAAERALALAPTDPRSVKASAYVAAARGDARQLAVAIETANAISPSTSVLAAQQSRLSHLLRTAALSKGESGQDQQPFQSPTASDAAQSASDTPQQVMVEVTLLLSQDTTKHTVGINLLDGLKLQFGGDNLTESRRSPGAADTFSRVITSALTVPQITYSLNLFNTHDDFYDVVVRPSLVATLGQNSEFFIGRTLSVGVSGINSGALQTIDVGTSVKLTPHEITRERTRFRVDTVRSFFVPTSSGTFAQSVATFKQTVGATAEVEFGKTLILSGLYEAVNVGWTSKVPILGDIPIVDMLFNERSKTQSRDAAIVLVTPRLAGSIETGTREFRTETLKRLLSLWKDLVDPLANMDALTGKIRGKVSKYFSPQPGDLSLPSAADATTTRNAIEETLERLR